MTSLEPARTRVERGADLLDHAWTGWETEVSLEDLNMVLHDRCVLGQLYGTYGVGLCELGIPTDARHYGFAGYSTSEDWDVLQREWVAELEARLRMIHPTEITATLDREAMNELALNWVSEVWHQWSAAAREASLTLPTIYTSHVPDPNHDVMGLLINHRWYLLTVEKSGDENTIVCREWFE